MKIVVLAGGTSTERKVSIVSGTGICRALREKKHQAILVDVFGGVESVDWSDPFPEKYDVDAASSYMKGFDEKLEEMKAERKDFFGPNVIALCQAADFVFLGLHGAPGEDGRVQAAFDLLGIRYSGSNYLSSAMAMNKGVTKQLFLMNGVPTPRGCAMKKGREIRDPEQLGMHYPLVAKTCCGGSSIGVYFADNREEFERALDEAFRYEEEVVVEERIIGTEYTVAVIDGEALPIVEIVPLEGFYDFENKYKPGATRETCPAPISAEAAAKMQKFAVKAFHALGLEGYARMDFIMKEDGSMVCLEANTLPGMTPTSLIPQEAAAIGMDYPTLCEKLIEVSMKKYTDR